METIVAGSLCIIMLPLVNFYCRTCATRFGERVTRKIVTSLHIEPDLLVALKALAVHERRRVNEVVVEAIRNHLALKGQAV